LIFSALVEGLFRTVRRYSGQLPAQFLPLLLLCLPTPTGAQDWNSPRALELIREARELRQGNTQDPDFRSYSSQARGYVHFFLDREDTGERILVKTDQIALEVYWAAPNLTKQRIVGLRDEKTLPTNIHYHLDHLVVVQDEFGDLIRIGDGDEVSAVIHPAAPGSETFYDFLLADSVTLILQGAAESVRVYELQVRPKNFDIPGFIGSVFLDRASSAIVRMSFTFTPASYVDSYLDHIQISLENGLWEGKYWLPYRQQLEIRREVPFLDIPAGSIIKGWFEVRDYEINPSLPPALFRGPRVSARPESERRSFPFEEGLHAHLDARGLDPPPEMGEIRDLAVSLARERYLTGLTGFRLHLPQPIVSSALRFNRAEGLFLGGGFSRGITPSFGLSGYGGFSFGREKPTVRMEGWGGEKHPDTRLSGYLNRPMDLGPNPGISGVFNTLSALALDEDYRDLFFASGVGAQHTWTPRGGSRIHLEGRFETHTSARDEVSSDPNEPRFRPVLPIENGAWRSVSLGVELPTPWRLLTTHGTALFGRFENRDFGSTAGGVRVQARSLGAGWDFAGSLTAGILWGDPPLQALYLVGGRGTVPGYDFRSRIGDRYWLLRGDLSKNVFSPWLRVRAFAAAGGTGYEGDPLLPPWPIEPGSSFLLSGGFGLGLGWDVLRLDLARGMREGGEWELMLSVNQAFWAWL
jgi:hypothetical protein